MNVTLVQSVAKSSVEKEQIRALLTSVKEVLVVLDQSTSKGEFVRTFKKNFDLKKGIFQDISFTIFSWLTLFVSYYFIF